MKKFLKIFLTIICWIGAIWFLFKTIKGFKYIDPWGLGFLFYTLPIGIIGILFLIESIILIKELITNKK